MRFRHLGKKDGLSQNSVFAIAQDSRGVMWFGTREGLNAYDGYTFRSYDEARRDQRSLIYKDIRHLAYDKSRDALWIGGERGLSMLKFSSDQFKHFYNSDSTACNLQGNDIQTIYLDARDRVWVGTDKGIHVLAPDKKNFEYLHFSNQKAAATKAFLEDEQELWIGAETGLFILKKDQKTALPAQKFFPELEQIQSFHFKTIHKTHPNQYWFGTSENGLFLWEKDLGLITGFQNKPNDPNTLSNNNIRSVAVGKDGTLWVGTWRGLNRYLSKEKGFQQILNDDLREDGLRDNSVRSVFVDNKNNLWVGTYYGSINYLNEEFSRFRTYKHQVGTNSLSYDVVSSFAETSEGNLWIGTEGGGLNFWDQKTDQFEAVLDSGAKSFSGRNVKTLLLDDSNLFIGSFQEGLQCYHTQSKIVKEWKHQPESANSLSNNNVYALLKDQNHLWIGTFGGGLNRLHLKDNQFTHFKHDPLDSNSLSSDYIRSILRIENNQLWVGTGHGLNKLTFEDEHLVQVQRFFTNIKIFTLQNIDQQIWIGTYDQGLICLDPVKETTQVFTTKDGLPGNSVLGIIKDAHGDFWLSTNNGISRFDYQKKTFTNYSHSDGLEDLEFNFNAFHQANNGDIIFGGTNGYTRFNPAQLQPNEAAPNLIFTDLIARNQSVKVNGPDGLLQHPIDHTERITFNYGEANFTLRFAALDYTNPAGNRYAYRMKGLTDEWTYVTGKPEATFTLQQEGNYTFELRGANKDGVWNETTRVLKIRVKPPMSRTWWAYLIYFALVAIGIFGLTRFVRLRASYQLEKVEKKRQEALHQMKLRFFTNVAHEFRTPLTLIIGPLEKLLQSAHENGQQYYQNQLLTIYSNAQRMLNLVNQLLTFRKMEAGHDPLKVKSVDLHELLKNTYKAFCDYAQTYNIDYQIQLPETKIDVWVDLEKIEKVLFNLLSNAFKFTAPGGQIVIGAKKIGDQVAISVSDNGSGIPSDLQEQIFQRFYEKNNEQGENLIKGTGIGLALSRQLVELHHGQLTVESQVDQGATFTIFIHLGKDHFQEKDFIREQFKVNADELAVAAPVAINQAKQTGNVTGSPIKNPDLKILIVEDNAEVLAFIQSIFLGEYQVITATDGLKGLEQAKKEMPDLILSDVMMPRMNGIDLCRTLKTQIETSHIPVLLLTARTLIDDRLEGLRIGADDYLTKPFHPNELQLKVRNILKQRQIMRARFSDDKEFTPKDVTVTSSDERFLEDLIELVEENIGNPDFKIEQFAQELAVSRALLFIKIKALTDMTPKNFLKSFRLKRAMQLLEAEKLNVSEIAYAVGFKEPRYFSKVFQKEFGHSPSQFLKNR